MKNFIDLSKKYNHLRLFSSFWIKRYLPLIYPILYFNKLLLSTEAEACAKLAIKNKEHCVKSVQIRSFFWSVFSCIWTGYPVRIQGNTDQKKLRIWTLFTQRKYHQQNASHQILVLAVNHWFKWEKIRVLIQRLVKHQFLQISNWKTDHTWILTGKKERQITLQRLQKVGIWTFGWLVHQINSL